MVYEMIKVGLIGCGSIMPAHLHGYKVLLDKNIDVRIGALCARKIEDAKRFRDSKSGPPKRKPVGPTGDPLRAPHIYVHDFQEDTEVEVYDDYRKMLKDADVDAVEIYTPVFSHHTIALSSLEAGKHVLVEKPLALTVKAARRMIETAEKSRKILGVAENARYNPRTRMTKWAIDKGYIGKIQTVVFGVFGGYWSPNKIVAKTPWRHKKLLAGGGATVDMGVHMFHIFRYLCGEVGEVSSVVKSLEKLRVTKDDSGKVIDQVEPDVDDTFFATIKFQNGAIGQTFFSWAGHGEETVVSRTIYGSRGCMKDDIIILDDGPKMEIKDTFENNASEAVKEKFFPYGITDPMALETLEFTRAIEVGRRMETNGWEGLRDLAASYAMIESSLLNSPIEVKRVESGEISRYQEEINKHYNI